MQADPHIQAPNNSQSYNRYSYVLNNPMSYTDPSGYFFKALGKFVKKYWRTIAAVAISVWLPGAGGLLNTAFGITNTIAQGAITGFIAGGVATGSLKGALVGAFTGAAFGALHNWKVSGFHLGKVAAHGAVGGIGSTLNGGKFGHGFFAAGFTQAVGQIGGDNLFTDGPIEIGDKISNAIKAAVIGGTASVISGGKFASGAVTGAFSRLLNDDQVSTAKEAFMKEHSINERQYNAVVRLVKNIQGLSTAVDSRMEFEAMLDALNSDQLQMLGKLTGVSVSNFKRFPDYARKALSDAYRYKQMDGILKMTAGAGKAASEIIYSDPAKNLLLNSSPSWIRNISNRYDNFKDFNSAVEDTF